MANANERSWQHMQEEASQELVGAESHRPVLIVLGVVLPPERDLAVLERNQSVIRDGHAMGIASEVMQDVLRSAEGPFCIYDPFLPEELSQKATEHLGMGEAFE